MATYEGHISNGLVGCKARFEFEIPDEDLDILNEEEVDAIALEQMLQNIEWDYWEKAKSKDSGKE